MLTMKYQYIIISGWARQFRATLLQGMARPEHQNLAKTYFSTIEDNLKKEKSFNFATIFENFQSESGMRFNKVGEPGSQSIIVYQTLNECPSIGQFRIQSIAKDANKAEDHKPEVEE